jgi:hypothetical protein
MTAIATTPAEIDIEMSRICGEVVKAERAISWALNALHTAAGDTRSARSLWKMTDDEARASASGFTKLINGEISARFDHALLVGQVQALNAIWNREGWTRYYFCTNTNGHIHTSERGCPTVHPTTQMAFRPEFSGLTPAEVVEQVGPALCSVCYPDAPVEHTSSNLTAIERAARRPELDARKAEIAAQRAIKRLTDEQVKQIGRIDGSWIETVHGCVEVLRSEVEFRDYYGRGEHPSHAEYVRGAALVKTVLAEREAASAGYGKTAADIETIIERAIKRNIKDGAREAKVRSF